MPKWESEYQRFVIEARLIYLNEIEPALIEAMYLQFAHTIERVVTDMGTGRITAERANALIASIAERMNDLSRGLQRDLSATISEAARTAVEGHAAALEAAGRAAGIRISQSFANVPELAILRMAQRRGFAGTFRTLINRNIAEMSDDVEVFLRDAVTRGLSGRRAGQELAALMARDDEALLQVLSQLGPRGGRTAAAIRQGVNIPQVQLKRARSILSDSYRIAITESNAAYFAADVESSAQSLVVDLVKWEVSGRHFGLPTSPDICTVYHQRDWTGYGPGLWHPRSVPSQPHSHCQCHVSKVLRSPNEWDKPKRDLPTPSAITNREMREVLEKSRAQHTGKPRTITPAHVRQQVRNGNSLVKLSDEVARRRLVEA